MQTSPKTTQKNQPKQPKQKGKERTTMVKIAGLSTALDPVEAGVYTTRIEEFTLSESKKGKAMYKVRLTITDDGPFQGRSLFDNFVVEDDFGMPFNVGIRRLAAFLRAAGVTIEDDEFDTSEAIGETVQVLTEVEQGEQGPQERIRKYIQV